MQYIVVEWTTQNLLKCEWAFLAFFLNAYTNYLGIPIIFEWINRSNNNIDEKGSREGFRQSFKLLTAVNLSTVAKLAFLSKHFHVNEWNVSTEDGFNGFNYNPLCFLLFQ